MALMSFALIGVMAMQYYFIKESYSLKSQLFDQAVNDALKNVSTKLEKKEAMVFLAQKVDRELKNNEKKPSFKRKSEKNQNPDYSKDNRLKHENQTIAFVKRMKANQAKSDSIFRMRDSLVRTKYPYKMVYNGPVIADNVPFSVNLKVDVDQIVDDYGFVHTIQRQSILETPPVLNGKRIVKRGVAVVDSVRKYMVQDPVLGTVLKTIPKPNFLTGISERELRLASQNHEKNQAKRVNNYLDSVELNGNKSAVFEDIASEMQQVNVPLEKRIQPQTIDSLLALELANNGINLNYSYKISSVQDDSVIFTKASVKQVNFIPVNTYKTLLFSKDLVRDAGYLSVTFPKKNTLILNNMGTVLLSSGGLLLILAASFIYTISSILRQKKVSEMKTDFINNMTHEFKTPVATIMIASEALKDPEINDNKARVNKLASIIYDENIRLGNHIERVLNIAKIEKDDLKLEQQQQDVNDIIANVVDSMSLQLEKKNARVSLELNASNSTVIADELHLSNVIFNLIDNANKYSLNEPEINLSTENIGDKIIIRIADKGIGMTRDQQKKIFEQFYRIPTGNLHDVKGFGLGLSYVSNMVKRMNGSISVKSEKDKGSEFEIKFTLA
ncbi:two-component sensor histidine kinase [Pedobacter psychrophilus]|uniref:histidine kinase n=2 Tax=Pedobacter psychrophilus TaxID=1826909 RepID=A0A179DFP6_9SPHI|nr:two-component sensor histidine kinase [Pedobacter psychrophilus]